MILAMKVDYKRLQHPALVFLFWGDQSSLVSVFFLDRAHGRIAGFMWVRYRCSLRSWQAGADLFLAWFLQNKTKSMDDCAIRCFGGRAYDGILG